MAWLKILHSDLVLFTFVVYITVLGHLWLALIFEESIVQYLIVNVDFAHLWLHTLAHFLLQSLRFISFSRLLPQLRNASLLDEVRQLEWNFVDASLVLQVAAFLSPVARDRH